MSDDKYKKAARIIVKSGALPFPVTDTLIEIVHEIYSDEEIDFINSAFKRKASQTIDQLKKYTKMPEEEILKNIETLAKKGAVFTSQSSSGLNIYRLLPLIMVGIFEYTFMKKVQHTEREKKIARLFKKILDEVSEATQERYDTMVPMFQQLEPFDRTIPILKSSEGKEISVEVNKEIEVSEEQIVPSQKVEEIIEKFDDIAVAHCFCRQHQELLEHSCAQDPPELCCFTFGKSAKFVSEQGFGKLVTKEEAFEILKKCDEAGLVHKAYHPHGLIDRDETSLCNCCKDCCGTFELWKSGAVAMINATNFLAITNLDLCTGCGTCVEKCPTDAIELNDNNKAERNEDWCIGCGVCAYFCPESAISMLEGKRKVFVPPPRLKQT